MREERYGNRFARLIGGRKVSEIIILRPLCGNFDIIFDHFSRNSAVHHLYTSLYTSRVLCTTKCLCSSSYRVLIGACNPMVCPMRVFRLVLLHGVAGVWNALLIANLTGNTWVSISAPECEEAFLDPARFSSVYRWRWRLATLTIPVYGDFDFLLDHFSRLFQLYPTRAVQYAQPSTHADRLLTGACNPMVCPIPAFRAVVIGAWVRQLRHLFGPFLAVFSVFNNTPAV